MSAIRSFFQEMLYAIPTLNVMDVVDILVVAFIIYKVMLLIRSTSASRVARSILLLLIVTWLTDVLHMYALNWIMTRIIEVGVIALVIVFQPELRLYFTCKRLQNQEEIRGARRKARRIPG